MAERERGEVHQVAEVAGEAREPGRNRDSRGRAQRRGPQRGQIVADAPRHAAAELHFAPFARVALLAKHGQRLAELADIESVDPAACVGGQRMHRPARDAPEPEGAVAAFAVEQRRAHDAVVAAARGDGTLARQLGGQETAVRVRMQPQG
jgi:hypothetical protein